MFLFNIWHIIIQVMFSQNIVRVRAYIVIRLGHIFIGRERSVGSLMVSQMGTKQTKCIVLHNIMNRKFHSFSFIVDEMAR